MKKVCVITSTRAEYGLLRPLIFELKKCPNIETQIIATGTHLDKRYGYTLDEILNDGLKPDACVEIIEDDTQIGILSTMANAVKKIGEKLEQLKPDMVILDVEMPKLNGLQVCEKIRNNSDPNLKNVPILIFSAYPSLPFSFLTRIFANRKFQDIIQLKHYSICISLRSPRPLW